MRGRLPGAQASDADLVWDWRQPTQCGSGWRDSRGQTRERTRDKVIRFDHGLTVSRKEESRMNA